VIPLSPALLIASANALVGVECRSESLGAGAPPVPDDDGAAVDVGWDATFAHHVGFWGHYDWRSEMSSWPLTRTRSAAALAVDAWQRGALTDAVEVGDLFLLGSPSGAGFTRTGIVAHVGLARVGPDGLSYQECVTIEGDTDEQLSPSGPKAVRCVRRLSAARGDRFVRWWALDVRHAMAQGARMGKRAACAVPEAAPALPALRLAA
jgi:hypothetical protein